MSDTNQNLPDLATVEIVALRFRDAGLTTASVRSDIFKAEDRVDSKGRVIKGTLGVKTVISRVSVGMPGKTKFIRVREVEENFYPTYFYTHDDDMDKESYLVMPEVIEEMGGLVREANLFYAIDNANIPFILPVPLPGADGKWNSWHESRAGGVELAKSRWLRFKSVKSSGAYDFVIGSEALPEPEWPDLDMEALIQIAFKGKVIDTVDHPINLGAF